MNDIAEVLRMPSPAPRPQAIASDGTTLWIGSIETSRLYAIDSQRWVVREEAAAPGKPWGATVVGDELRVVSGETSEDHRIIRRFIPGHGFKSTWGIPCPDDTGSHLGFDGDRLYLSQWYNKRVLSIDESGAVGTIVDIPREVCGLTVVDGRFFLLTTEDESKPEYFITRVDARGATPVVDDVASVPFHARGIAFDGERFWTNHREAHEVVAFRITA
jgi:hypothetical protein